MSTCFVKGCRHNLKHNTTNHQCGTCGVKGHGQIECGHRYLIEKLRKHTGSNLSHPQCNVTFCPLKNSHTREEHKCFMCGTLGHPEWNCSKRVKLTRSDENEPILEKVMKERVFDVFSKHFEKAEQWGFWESLGPSTST